MPQLVDSPIVRETGSREGTLWLRCQSGPITSLIAHSGVSSIHRREHWEPVSGEAALAGWLVVPGSRVPVYHLAALLGQPWSQQPRSALRVRTAGPQFAVGVDSLSRLTLPAGTQHAALPWVLRKSVRNAVAAIADTGQGLAICVDVELLNPALNPAMDGGVSHMAASARQPGMGFAGARGPAAAAVTPGAVGKLLAFHLPGPVAGGTTPLIGLSFLQVLEVAESLPYLPLPGSAAEMPGLVWWRDHPVPFVDLTYCLGGEPTQYRGETILVARGSRSTEALAIPVGDEVSGMSMTVACSACSEPFQPRLDCLRGEFDLGWERLLIPDLDKFFA